MHYAALQRLLIAMTLRQVRESIESCAVEMSSFIPSSASGRIMDIDRCLPPATEGRISSCEALLRMRLSSCVTLTSSSSRMVSSSRTRRRRSFSSSISFLFRDVCRRPSLSSSLRHSVLCFTQFPQGGPPRHYLQKLSETGAALSSIKKRTFVFRSLHTEHDKDVLRRVRIDFNVGFAGGVWPFKLDAGAK